MNTNLRIGTCGFNGSKADYSQQLACVEIQHTFYQPPQLATLERWRAQVPENFEFTLKAWQLITHQAKSPTYKRLRIKLTQQQLEEAGFFKPTTIVQQAWQTTLECAKALRAETILFQCPASFTQTPTHIRQLTDFFTNIDRTGLTLGWEPRGNWDREVLEELCHDLQLWHVVDPFTMATVTPEQCYFRLHGRQGWRYQYDSQELVELAELIPINKPSYVFFNNVHMWEDALSFKRLLETSPNY